MMRNPEQTIGNLVDKVSTPVISYIDGEGYPVSRAMLAPRAVSYTHLLHGFNAVLTPTAQWLNEGIVRAYQREFFRRI